MYDVCSCLGNGFCPRCGEHVFSDEDLEQLGNEPSLVCSRCGWCENLRTPARKNMNVGDVVNNVESRCKIVGQRRQLF